MIHLNWIPKIQNPPSSGWYLVKFTDLDTSQTYYNLESNRWETDRSFIEWAIISEEIKSTVSKNPPTNDAATISLLNEQVLKLLGEIQKISEERNEIMKKYIKLKQELSKVSTILNAFLE